MAKANPSAPSKPPRLAAQSGGRWIRDPETGALSPAPNSTQSAADAVQEGN